jgi:hypothetical protein
MWGWGGSQILCYYSCFASKVVRFSFPKPLKIAISLFPETSETNLFVSDSVETSFGFSFGFLDLNQVP